MTGLIILPIPPPPGIIFLKLEAAFLTSSNGLVTNLNIDLALSSTGLTNLEPLILAPIDFIAAPAILGNVLAKSFILTKNLPISPIAFPSFPILPSFLNWPVVSLNVFIPVLAPVKPALNALPIRAMPFNISTLKNLAIPLLITLTGKNRALIASFEDFKIPLPKNLTTLVKASARPTTKPALSASMSVGNPRIPAAAFSALLSNWPRPSVLSTIWFNALRVSSAILFFSFASSALPSLSELRL